MASSALSSSPSSTMLSGGNDEESMSMVQPLEPYSNDKDKKDSPSSLSSSSSSSLQTEGVVRNYLMALSWIILYVGWNYPRYKIHADTSIVKRIPPYQETAAGDVLLDFLINEPLVDPPTIPSRLLVWTSVYIPFVVVFAVSWWYRSTVRRGRWIQEDAFSGLSGLAMAIGVGEGATQLLKLAIQRRRPNFYALCGFDRVQKQCLGDAENIKEANFSFPSGHSSLSACGMTFVTLYIIGKIWRYHELISSSSSSSSSSATSPSRIGFSFWVPPQFQAFLVCTILEGWTILVAASRLLDKWHHPSDVVAGLLLGSVTAAVVYHVWFTPFTGHARM